MHKIVMVRATCEIVTLTATGPREALEALRRSNFVHLEHHRGLLADSEPDLAQAVVYNDQFLAGVSGETTHRPHDEHREETQALPNRR
jgi:hypothetical protein